MRSALLVAVLGVAFVTGCADRDRKVSEYKPDRPLPLAAEAPKKSEYQLFAVDTPHPLFNITLERSADFGFRNNGGTIVAFAQRLNESSGKPIFEDIEIPLPGGDRVGYYWLQVAPKKK